MARNSGLSIHSCHAEAPTAPVSQAEHELSVQFEIEESEKATIQTTLDSRPVNTKRKYEAYQTEFLQWCEGRHFRDRDTVTGGKLHLFLSTTIIGRKSKKNSSKMVGSSTVCGYANVIVDLYNVHVTLRTNSNPHPRTASVKQLIKNVQAQSTATRCTALVLLIQHGKPNTFGKLQHVGYMRNRDVHVCPVGAVTLYYLNYST
ncbi:hypothetical protein PHMEG_0005058 [Phytophthora megakarya]|uniref:Ndc10 domain-containing protein n=1 Tax=Phytophthora megakarya TaxID=4795 RepID=A0A225WSD4_9STRA|nr:hypothetical protein PHMEG_0005058 [Phytophthora megakarya]